MLLIQRREERLSALFDDDGKEERERFLKGREQIQMSEQRSEQSRADGKSFLHFYYHAVSSVLVFSIVDVSVREHRRRERA